MKKQEGITLIALVITIIVLLILAGVSIAMISGSDGILTKASKAGSDTKVAEAKELVSLDVSEQISAYYDAKYASTTPPTETTPGAYVKAHLTSSDQNKYTVDASATNKQITIIPKTNDGKTQKGTIGTKGTIEWEDPE